MRRFQTNRRSVRTLSVLLLVCLAVSLSLVLCLVLFTAPAHALPNGLARRPFMGFNTWNYFACNISQTLIKETIDSVAGLGLKDLGYEYVNIDDCWQAPSRDAEGNLQPHPERFPDGIKPLVDYAHSKGLKLGIYSDAGFMTCARYPGSLGHEKQDAQLWADWGVDLLKYDNCYAPDFNVKGRYTTMRDALKATGAPILYSLCSWGWGKPWQWGQSVGNSWRTAGDIAATNRDILRSLDSVVGLSRYAGPGGWNDPDMLEVGNGDLSLAMQRSHFALWALIKAPLLIGTDLRTAKPESVEILKARELIAINQDELGIPGDLVEHTGELQVWAAPLKGGARAVVLFNRREPHPSSDTPDNITVRWVSIGLAADVEVSIRDLFAGKDLGTATGSYTAAVAGHDVAALMLTPVQPSMRYEAWRPWHAPLQRHVQPLIKAREAAFAAQQATVWGHREMGQHMRQQRGQQALLIVDVPFGGNLAFPEHEQE